MRMVPVVGTGCSLPVHSTFRPPPRTGRCMIDAMATPVVAVLGTGVMGAGMVGSLRRAGIEVRAWNRDPAKARALSGTGAQAMDSPADAVARADVVVTMLFDADSTIDVVRQAAPAPGTVWLQTATVGIEGADRTVEAAAELGLVLVDCPVLGTRKPAEDGTLVMLASGPREDVEERLAPVLDAVGSRTLWAGEAGQGTRLKLACNAWVLSVTAGVAQSIALARGLGVDPQHFLDAIAGGASDTPYAHVKGAAMMAGEYPVSFSLAGGLKDGRLIAEALRSAGVTDQLAGAMVSALEVAADQVPDPNTVDLAALFAAFAPRAG